MSIFIDSIMHEIRSSISVAEIEERNITIEIASERNFGDYVAHVITNYGDFKIIRDRGKYFVDELIGSSYVYTSSIYDSVAKIHLNQEWHLHEILKSIKMEKKASALKT